MAKSVRKDKPVQSGKELPLWRREHFYAWAVFLFSLCLYANSIFNGYNLDDELVTINHRLTSRGIAAIPDIFTSPYYQDESGYSYEYRPVVLASFAIEHQLFGDSAFISHFFNVLIYALCCFLLYHVLQLLFNKKNSFVFTLGVALLFAAHPAHTEVVCSIKNRDEILALLFGLLALYAAVMMVRTSRLWWILLVLLFYALAVMSKVTILPFSFIIPMALILFCGAGIFYASLAALALALPAYFFSTAHAGWEKLLLALFTVIFPLIIYVCYNISEAPLFIVKQYSRIIVLLRRGAARVFSSKTLSIPAGDYPDFKHFYKRIVPDKRAWAFFPFLTTLCLAGLYSLLVFTNYSLIACIPAAALVLLIWRGEEGIAWWANVMLGACLVLDVALIDYALKTAIRDYVLESIFVRTVGLYFCYQIFFGGRGILIPFLIYFLTKSGLNILVCHNWEGFEAFLLVVLYARPARLIIGIACIVFIMHGIFTTISYDIINLLIILGIVLSVQFNRGKSVFNALALIVMLIVFHREFLLNDKSFREHAAIVLNAPRRIDPEALNPEIVTAKQDRPLTFIEECITKTTPFSVKAGTSFEILFHYLHKVVLPYPMSFYYGYKYIYPQKITEPVPVLSMVIHVLLLLSAFYFLRKNPRLGFGLLIYLISISSVSNYFFTVPGMIAERFLLIPSIGWTIVLAVILEKIFLGKIAGDFNDLFALPRNAKYAFAAVVILYSSITVARNFDWKSDLQLFRHDINYVNQSAQAHNLLALHIMKTVQTVSDPQQKTAMEKEAILHFKMSKEIYPYFFNVSYDIGRVYASLNMPDSAIAAFQQASTLDTVFPDLYHSLGSLLTAKGKYEEAVPYLQKLVTLDPTLYDAYYLLSLSYFKMGEYDKSIAVNYKATRQFPQLPDPLINLGRTYIEINQLDSARLCLNKANELAPGNPTVREMLRQTER